MTGVVAFVCLLHSHKFPSYAIVKVTLEIRSHPSCIQDLPLIEYLGPFVIEQRFGPIQAQLGYF